MGNRDRRRLRQGPEAAALTALARYTIRAVADRGPAQVLSLLNEAVLRDQGVDNRFLTALFAELTHTDGAIAVELAAGGHPAPYVQRAGGTVETVAVKGPVVGVVPGVDYAATRVTLSVGDKLIFYTDGLADARAPDLVLSEVELAALVAEGRGLDGQELAEFLEARATGDTDARDDIVIVVLEAVGQGADALSVHYFAGAAK